MPAAKFEITRQCKVCGETFVAKTIESWYCSPKCSKIACGKSSVSCPLKPSDSAPLKHSTMPP